MISSSCLIVLVLLLSVSRISANFIDALPNCWQDCIDQNKNSSCNSGRCICKHSSDSSFLPETVACARSNCHIKNWTVDMLLIPLQDYCAAIGKDIPSSIISSAECAATETSRSSLAPVQTTDTRDSKTQKTEPEEDNTSTMFTNTVIQTTTNDAGATLVVFVPMEVQPHTIMYGKTSTSTLGTTVSPTSVDASPSQTISRSPPTPTGIQQGQIGSSTTSSGKAQKTSNSNGSPFENMQAGAGILRPVGGLLVIVLFAAMFLKL
ncbi:hypothetical protein GQ43DRAFT_445406 [Delitschia confertaspora ATCC 74209]|uniref:Extracellular membrane protein CFEM domain-containing protein n=1 Tax=Delitschia confertaspora ATCC 74209 TaxID=1513339 RepID=A0A9P4MMH9_9PLEO|nr:hypothetical protein GQ43DRAFT_445406 [Delitschia confertaspora ATCC 74209]